MGVHVPVGRCQRVTDVFGTGKRVDAYRHMDRHRTALMIHRDLHDLSGQMLGFFPRGRLIGPVQNDPELIAAQASHDVGLTHAGKQKLGDVFERFVAGGMTVGIVDLFEVVNVDIYVRPAPYF